MRVAEAERLSCDVLAGGRSSDGVTSSAPTPQAQDTQQSPHRVVPMFNKAGDDMDLYLSCFKLIMEGQAWTRGMLQTEEFTKVDKKRQGFSFQGQA